MTYQANRDALSREPLNIVELGLDTTITEGGTEYVSDGYTPIGQHFWPCIKSIEWVPTRASKDGGLGYFGQIVVKCEDFDWPNGEGSYFGRLLASNPYTLNRQLKAHVGYFSPGDAFSFSDFQERRYFIKKVSGPDHNRIVRFEASDVLSQLKESQIPAASYGNLASSLTNSATGTINIGNNEGFDASGGRAIIGDELILYSGLSGADSIVVTSRGIGGTESESHDAGDPVRNIYYFSGNSVDCIREIIESYSEIDHASYIPDSDWNTERDDFLSSENVEVWVTEPTELDKVIDKIGKQTYTNVWWDDAAQEIKLKAIGPTLTSATAWNDDENILDDKVTIKRDQREIITQVWVYYGKRNQTGSDDADNYKELYIKVDAEAETGLGQPKIKKIFADYLPANASATASKIASRITSQNATPLEFILSVDARDSDLDVGDPVDITTDLYQGTDGLPQAVKLRVVEKAQALNNRYKYKMVFSGVEQGNRYPVIAPNTVVDYDSETIANQNKYGWIADALEKVGAADDDPYLIL